MAAPLIYIGTHTIKQGKLEEFRRYMLEFSEFVKANEPRLIHFECYVNEEGTELTVLQVHPDVQSMELHMQVGAEHFHRAYDFLESTKSMQIYGTPTEALLNAMRQATEPNVPLIVKSEYAGFSRLPAPAGKAAA